ncbi:MAG: TlpA disulfide reductase family protein [Anaerolineae bacterium]|nr:TlpA family protein disulfide reductase [Anaerolineae bacterium]MDW8099908.1 TlpA disulfide reductase family protein [Anaerolineae bacterium]
MRRSRWLRPTLLAAVAALGLAWIQMSRVPSSGPASAPPTEARVGFTAPDFTLPQVDGQMLSLRELRGQVVILNFWATWCAPCRAEMPALDRVYRDRHKDGVAVVGVNQLEAAIQVQRYLGQLSLSFPIALDERGKVGRIYRVHALPTTYFVDRQGIIRDMVIGGPMSEATLQSKIAALLDE